MSCGSLDPVGTSCGFAFVRKFAADADQVQAHIPLGSLYYLQPKNAHARVWAHQTHESVGVWVLLSLCVCCVHATGDVKINGRAASQINMSALRNHMQHHVGDFCCQMPGYSFKRRRRAGVGDQKQTTANDLRRVRGTLPSSQAPSSQGNGGHEFSALAGF